MQLRYGTNPHQASAHAAPVRPGDWPVRLLNGEPSFINMLDALNGWQLVQETSRLMSRPAAASFKHVSPAGGAVSGPLDGVMEEQFGVVGDSLEGVTKAYLRARDADPKSSYGDFVALSHPVGTELAELLAGLFCDGIIAPGYAPGTVDTLSGKKNGRFVVMEADEAFIPPKSETREVFGVRLTQERDEAPLSATLFEHTALPETAVADLLLGLVVSRYTQSNSVCYIRDGMTLGIGAGQQSRVDCTRLAGAKVDTWWMRRHPALRALDFTPDMRRQDRINTQIRLIENDLTADQRAEWMQSLTGVAFTSDGALPFRDNVDHAARHGVEYIAEPGGSIRSGEVEEACREQGITLVHTGLRLFHH
jgi:AICAR transformylase/IMP cyclohydrolase PurH